MLSVRVIAERRRNRILILKSSGLKSLKTVEKPEFRSALMVLFALLPQISAQFKKHLACEANVSTL